MIASPSRILGFALAAAALVSADAFELARRQLNAQSIPTAEFKSRFVQSGIVPEIIAALDPSVSFYVSYKTQNNQDALLVPGSSLTLSETTFPFEFSVENLNNATNITTATRYLIYLMDADAPARDDTTQGNLRHYLAGNFTLSSLTSTVLPTSTRLFQPAVLTRPFTQFVQPNPAPNTGVHRFIWALYTQPANFNNAGFESVGMAAETNNWNLAQWRMQLGLGPAIGATYFTIDTNANNGQGTSGQVNTQAGGPGMAAGLSAPAYMVIATAAALSALMFL